MAATSLTPPRHLAYNHEAHAAAHLHLCSRQAPAPPFSLIPFNPIPVILNDTNLGFDVAAGGEPFSTLEQRGDAEALQENALLLRGTRAEGSGLPMKVRH